MANPQTSWADAFFFWGGGGGETIVSEAKKKKKKERTIWPELHVLHAALARQRLRAGLWLCWSALCNLWVAYVHRSEAWRKCIETWWKCCASKLDEGAVHRNLMKVLRIEAWRKCCASRLDESAAHFVPAVHQYFFKKRTWPKPHSPKPRVFVFSQTSLITDGPLIYLFYLFIFL